MFLYWSISLNLSGDSFLAIFNRSASLRSDLRLKVWILSNDCSSSVVFTRIFKLDFIEDFLLNTLDFLGCLSAEELWDLIDLGLKEPAPLYYGDILDFLF